MKATLCNGDVMDIRPGQNVMGSQFVKVELEYADIGAGAEWLSHILMTRMVPVGFCNGEKREYAYVDGVLVERRK